MRNSCKTSYKCVTKVSWPGSTSHDTLPHPPLHPLPPPIIMFLIDFKFPATQCMSFRNSAGELAELCDEIWFTELLFNTGFVLV